MRANADRASGVRLVTDSPHTRPPVSPEHDRDAEIDALLEAATSVLPTDVVALCGRQNSGLSVQLLTTTSDDVRAWITLDVNGATETFEIEPKDALDAFAHPYAYGATLPL